MKISIKILILICLFFQTCFIYSKPNYQYQDDVGYIIYIQGSQKHIYSYLINKYVNFSCLKTSHICKDEAGHIHFKDENSNWNRIVKFDILGIAEYFLINPQFEAFEISENDYYSIVFYFDLMFGEENPEHFSIKRLNEIIDYSKNNFDDNEDLQDLIKEIENHHKYSRLVYEQHITSIQAHTAIAPMLVIWSSAKGFFTFKALLSTLGLWLACWIVVDEWLGSHSYQKFCSPNVTPHHGEKYMEILHKNKEYDKKWDKIIERRNPKLHKEIMKEREKARERGGKKLFLKEIYKRGERIG